MKRDAEFGLVVVAYFDGGSITSEVGVFESDEKSVEVLAHRTEGKGRDLKFEI